jgi:photosystem II stability/assembly factor-like uncharacterized protein
MRTPLARAIFSLWLFNLLTPVAGAAPPLPYQDGLDTPAVMSNWASKNELMSVRQAGNHLVAVGPRGHIVISDANGTNWKQVKSPVSTDLVALYFPTATQGWAVGHDGVILHSDDGGNSWRKQLDGRQAVASMSTYYEHLAQSGDPAAIKVAAEVKAFAPGAIATPFLDVWFRNEREGYAVGAFNLIFKTDDGGSNWIPWYALTDNPRRLHLNAIGASGDALYIVGEQGLVLRLDQAGKRFVAIKTPYTGSFFGLVTSAATVVAFGLRGNAWASEDDARTWRQLETGTSQALVAGSALTDNSFVLTTVDGTLLKGRFDANRLAPVQPETRLHRVYGVAAYATNSGKQGNSISKLVLAGGRGIDLQPQP